MSDIKLERTPSIRLYRYLQAELGALALNVSLLQAEQWRFSVDSLAVAVRSSVSSLHRGLQIWQMGTESI